MVHFLRVRLFDTKDCATVERCELGCRDTNEENIIPSRQDGVVCRVDKECWGSGRGAKAQDMVSYMKANTTMMSLNSQLVSQLCGVSGSNLSCFPTYVVAVPGGWALWPDAV